MVCSPFLFNIAVKDGACALLGPIYTLDCWCHISRNALDRGLEIGGIV